MPVTNDDRADNGLANARLIALAPDLLQACKEMAEIISLMTDGGADPYLEIIRQAEKGID